MEAVLPALCRTPPLGSFTPVTLVATDLVV